MNFLSRKQHSDDEFEDLPLDDDEPVLKLRIKSSSDVQIVARPHDSISNFKVAVLKALDQETTNYIRLIASGRLLAPDSARLRDFVQIQNGAVIHAVVSHKKGAQAAAASNLLSRRALRGTGVNAQGWAVRANVSAADEEEASGEESEVEDLEVGRRRRRRLGFDRLRDTIGFRRSEVASIRSYFARSVDRWIRENPVVAEQAAAGETDLVRRRLLQEDAWMQAQGPASEFRINLGNSQAEAPPSEMHMWRSGTMGTDRDFMWGFMLGFFVGFLMLLWVWMPTVPHKQKLGILAGISFQLALGMLQAPDEGVGGGGGVGDDLVLSDY